MKLQQRNHSSTKHRESIICRHSFREIISHMRDQRQDAVMCRRLPVLPRTTFEPDQVKSTAWLAAALVLEDRRL